MKKDEFDKKLDHFKLKWIIFYNKTQFVSLPYNAYYKSVFLYHQNKHKLLFMLIVSFLYYFIAIEKDKIAFSRIWMGMMQINPRTNGLSCKYSWY